MEHNSNPLACHKYSYNLTLAIPSIYIVSDLKISVVIMSALAHDTQSHDHIHIYLFLDHTSKAPLLHPIVVYLAFRNPPSRG